MSRVETDSPWKMVTWGTVEASLSRKGVSEMEYRNNLSYSHNPPNTYQPHQNNQNPHLNLHLIPRYLLLSHLTSPNRPDDYGVE